MKHIEPNTSKMPTTSILIYQFRCALPPPPCKMILLRPATATERAWHVGISIVLLRDHPAADSTCSWLCTWMRVQTSRTASDTGGLPDDLPTIAAHVSLCDALCAPVRHGVVACSASRGTFAAASTQRTSILDIDTSDNFQRELSTPGCHSRAGCTDVVRCCASAISGGAMPSRHVTSLSD